ncbi:unnamed protein product [Caenorhabditis brenneri]
MSGIAPDFQNQSIERETPQTKNHTVHLEYLDLYGCTGQIQIETSAFVLEVKTVLEEKEGLDVDKQILFHRGRTLENWKRLQDYGIRKDGEILIMQTKLKKFVDFIVYTLNFTPMRVKFDNSSTFRDLAKAVQKRESNPKFDYFVCCEKKMHPNAKMHLVTDFSVIYMVAKQETLQRAVEVGDNDEEIGLKVKGFRGEDFPVFLRINDSTDLLKRKIFEEIGLPQGMQRLIYAGRTIESGRSLASYNLKCGSVIHSVMRLPFRPESYFPYIQPPYPSY